eukprot:TRINITY_DN16062_c0_g1_i1.p2 TRINITY_DN16062_c0_g1~~TRINITY_DN16062_c0_g1_i1.p2  ORF type:complete len:54 (+),score=9.40 TRINITY_DN16062_c0_g1_i1:391-552(+)
MFHIRIFNGTNSGEEYLSCASDGLVDLYSRDDGSGRQLWMIDTLSSDRHLSGL